MGRTVRLKLGVSVFTTPSVLRIWILVGNWVSIRVLKMNKDRKDVRILFQKEHPCQSIHKYHIIPKTKRRSNGFRTPNITVNQFRGKGWWHFMFVQWGSGHLCTYTIFTSRKNNANLRQRHKFMYIVQSRMQSLRTRMTKSIVPQLELILSSRITNSYA